MQKNRADSRAMLRDRGMRVTGPRLDVLEALLASDRPLAHSEVVERLSEASWDQATVYRNLVKLVEIGLARVASEAGGLRRYEAIGAPTHESRAHPHFLCVECGSVQCLPETTLVSQPAPSWRRSIERAEVQLHGRCPECSQNA